MGTPDRPKITPEQREQAIELQARGLTHRRIAAELGLSREAVTRALGRWNRQATERLLRRAVSEKGRQLAILDRIIERALEEFGRSSRDAVIVKETVGGQFGDKTETTTKGQTGDARLLSRAMEAMEQRRKLLGIDRPDDDDTADALTVADLMRGVRAENPGMDSYLAAEVRQLIEGHIKRQRDPMAEADYRNQMYNPEDDDI